MKDDDSISVEPVIDKNESRPSRFDWTLFRINATNTFPANNPEWRTVSLKWEETNPKHFFEVVGKLHDTAGNIVKLHQELFRKARFKLGA